MSTSLFVAVLGAALCHAAWNAALKVRLDPGIAITLISVAAGIIAVPALPVLGIPHPASWPYLAASLAIHLFYYIWLAEAYRTADLGQVYPIARGSAPLITAAGSTLLFGERLVAVAWIGIALLTMGVMLLSVRGGRHGAVFDGRAVGFALATAATISAYTLIDGRGARLSQAPHAYAAWLFVLDGVMMAAYGWARQRQGICAVPANAYAVLLGGGALSLASYWIAIWAMSLAPIPLVAAVRETSVLFAAAIGVIWLKEPLLAPRMLAAMLVVGGLALLRLA